MSALERIWAKDKHDAWGTVGDWYSHCKGGGTEYVRADLFDALQAENKRLREALGSIARNTCCDGCRESGLVASAALIAADATTKTADNAAPRTP